MILIILFAILVSVCIAYIAWDITAMKPRTKESGEAKEPKDLPDS